MQTRVSLSLHKIVVAYQRMSDDYDYDNNESTVQRGWKVESIEVKRLKERIRRKDRELDELVNENKRLKSELRKALSSNSRGTKGDIRKDNDWRCGARVGGEKTRK